MFPSLWYNRKIKPLWIRLSSMYFEIKKNLHFQPFLEQNTKCLVYVFICISMDQAIFREIWCMTIPNWADKNFPLSSPENPICHHSQFILPLICTDHHLIVPLLLWRSQPLGPWTHLLSAGLSTHTSWPGDEGISNNQRNQPHWLILAWTSSSYSQRRSKPLTQVCTCHLLATFQTIIWYPIIFQLSSPYIYKLL